MRIVFMGTPDFSLNVLKELYEDKQNIIAVYTQAPKPSGRGNKLTHSPVHDFANLNNIPVYTPKSLRKSEEEQEKLCNLNPDIIIVVAYGLILPKKVLDFPKYGCINIHASLLPRWRGSAPIQHSIIAGDKKTGITIMKMDEGIDTGDMMLKEEVDIANNETTPTLFEKLSKTSASLIKVAIEKIKNNEVVMEKQVDTDATYAPMIKKTDGLINFNDNAETIERKIRAFINWPTCYIEFNGENIKILESKVIKNESNAEIGEIIDDNITIKCKTDAIMPTILQRPGKKPTNLKDFINGYKLLKRGVRLQVK